MSASTKREVLVITALSVLLALIYNTFSPKGLPLVRVEPNKTLVSDSALFSDVDSLRHTPDSSQWKDIKVIAPLHEQALRNPDSLKALVQKKEEVERKKAETVYRVITLTQLQKLLKAKRGILFDARSEEDYLKGHIKGAKNVPGLDPGKYFEHFVQMPRDTLVIIYCNNPECHLGRELAKFLAVLEFNNMVLYDDGFDGWEKAKMPVDTTVTGF